jgi:hypothetical protein
MWELQHLMTLWAFAACYRDSFFTENSMLVVSIRVTGVEREISKKILFPEQCTHA